MGESPSESTTMEAPLFRLPTEPIKRTLNEFEFMAPCGGDVCLGL